MTSVYTHPVAPPHPRLHRRGHSASSLSRSSPLIHQLSSTQTSPDLSAPTYTTRAIPSRPPLPVAPRRKMSYEDYLDGYTARAASPAHGGSSFKIKPYLRKMSLKDDTKIDLSRPSAENESLTGLNIGQDVTSHLSSRPVVDVSFTSVGARARHVRSTSNTSNYSTSSTGLRQPTMPYSHPMRATPRPYTPPIATSFNTSMVDIDFDPEEDLTEEELRYRAAIILNQIQRDADGLSDLPPVPPPKTLHSTSSRSSLRRPTNTSQTSFSGASTPAPLTTGRSRGNTLRSIDTATSPSSRTSLEKALSSLIHPHRTEDAPHQANSRAASIQAARQAYAEREEAKAQKAEKDEQRRQSKEARRIQARELKEEKRQKRRRAKSDATVLDDATATTSDADRTHRKSKKACKSLKSLSRTTVSSLPSEEKLSAMTGLAAATSPAPRAQGGVLSYAYTETAPALESQLPDLGQEPLSPTSYQDFGFIDGSSQRKPSMSAGMAARTAYERRRAAEAEAAKRSARSRWLSFMAWFRTRLMRMGAGVHYS